MRLCSPYSVLNACNASVKLAFSKRCLTKRLKVFEADLHDIAAFHTCISNYCGLLHYCGESPFLRLPDPPLLGTCGQLLSSVPVDALEATPRKEIPEKLASLLEKANAGVEI